MALLLAGYFFQFIICAVVFYLTGAILRNQFSSATETSSAKVFLNSLTGVTFYIFVYSVYKTHFHTVNLGLIIPVLYLFFSGEKSKQLREKFSQWISVDRKTLFELLIFSVAVFFFHVWIHTEKFSGTIALHPDQVCYSNLSEFLNATGLENLNFDYCFTGNSGVDPSHYFEIWLNALITAANGQLSLPNQLFITLPYGIFLCCAGFRAFIFKGTKYWRMILLSLLLLSLSGLGFKFYNHTYIMREAFAFSVNVVGYEKLFPVYIFFISCFYFLSQKNYTSFFALALCLPVVNTGSAPAIFITLFLFTILKFKNHPAEINRCKNIFFLLISAIFMVVFYYTSKHEGPSIIFSLPELIKQYGNKSGIITAFHIAGKTIIQMFVLYLPYIILFGFAFHLMKIKVRDELNKNKLIVFFTASIFFSSLFAWALFNQMFNAIQLFNNIAVPALNIFIGFIIIKLFAGSMTASRAARPALILIACLLVFCSFRSIVFAPQFEIMKHYDQKYTEQVKLLVNNLNPHGAFICDSSEYKNTFLKIPGYNIPALHLKLYKPDAFLFSLSVVHTPLSDEPRARHIEEMLIANASFSKFIKKQKEEKQFVSDEQSMVDFIRQYYIEYLVLTKNAKLPAGLKSLVRDSLTDPVSGETFMTLK